MRFEAHLSCSVWVLRQESILVLLSITPFLTFDETDKCLIIGNSLLTSVFDCCYVSQTFSWLHFLADLPTFLIIDETEKCLVIGNSLLTSVFVFRYVSQISSLPHFLASLPTPFDF